MKKLGIYIHIPFCARKCKYCDFLSISDVSVSVQKSYMQSLNDEVAWYASGVGMAGGRGIDMGEYEADTIFIGGGTPSLIEPELLCDFLGCIRKKIRVSENAEISLEANPGTLNAESLAAYKAAGFNRISFGVQSFDDRLLEVLGRIHSSTEARESFKKARQAGFDNINIDLMFGIPGQDLDSWTRTFVETLVLGPEHISFYSLKFEEGTPFYDMLKKGQLQEMDDDLDRQMYSTALDLLDQPSFNGTHQAYVHYEISNAARQGFACRHNLKYWSMEEYLGFGLGAHSFMNGERFSNECDMSAYLSNNNGSHVAWRHQNSIDDEISEYIFTGLRKIEGINLQNYAERFGESIRIRFGDEIDELVQNRLMEISLNQLKLTPIGIDISNSVLSRFV